MNPPSVLGSRKAACSKSPLDMRIITDMVPHMSDVSHEVTIKIKETDTTDQDIDISNDNPSRFIDDLGIKT